jgi:hypothetical protein
LFDVNISDGLKRSFFPLSLVVGIALVWLLSPLDWFEGIMLFFFGSVAGDWDRRLNPVVDSRQGPILPWDEMHAGDKLAHFFPGLVITVFGFILLAVGIQFSRVTTEWEMIGIGMLLVATGIGQGWLNWHHRYR